MKSSNNKQHKLFHIIRETKALLRPKKCPHACIRMHKTAKKRSQLFDSAVWKGKSANAIEKRR